ncbi:MAG: M42 family metallopeptidase [Clostridia bacterium]|nr:M42 family metallopeptidase [Clostridia bacterium]
MQSAETVFEYLRTLSAIPSPTGMTGACADAVCSMLAGMGFSPVKTRKGAVRCRVAEGGHPLLLCAHLDTLGMAVRAVKPTGRLRYSRIGGWNDNAVENENVLIHTRSGKVFSGTVQSVYASRHVWGDKTAEARSDSTLEIVLDEDVSSAADVAALGIRAGDMVSFDPRLVRTESGYVKCRFLDDKASAAVLLTLARDIAEGRLVPGRAVTLAFTVYEEIGHGASDLYAEDAEDIVAVDMGCVGDDLTCRETQVSVCAKDAAGPYDWDLTNSLIARSERLGIDYTVDVYPNYSSDANTALKGGLDARFACFGPGVFASHAYERTHMKALEGTLRLAEDLARTV